MPDEIIVYDSYKDVLEIIMELPFDYEQSCPKGIILLFFEIYKWLNNK